MEIYKLNAKIQERILYRQSSDESFENRVLCPECGENFDFHVRGCVLCDECLGIVERGDEYGIMEG